MEKIAEEGNIFKSILMPWNCTTQIKDTKYLKPSDPKDQLKKKKKASACLLFFHCVSV